MLGSRVVELEVVRGAAAVVAALRAEDVAVWAARVAAEEIAINNNFDSRFK
jgi:hypothetical protein